MTVRKTKKKTKAKVTTLPKGFEPISGFGISWPNDDIKKGAMLVGAIIEYDEVDVKRGGKTETVQNLKLETKEGEVFTLWKSAGLRPLFEYEEGTKVAVIFDGMGKAKRGQNAPRLYRLGIA